MKTKFFKTNGTFKKFEIKSINKKAMKKIKGGIGNDETVDV